MKKESIVSIDINALDREWLTQAPMMEKYCKLLVYAKEKVSIRKAALSVIEAEVEFDIRKNPKKYGIVPPIRISESAIKSKIVLDKRYQKGQRRLILAQKKEGMIEAVVKALPHRKSSLENLVTLFLQSYFSAPSGKNIDTDGFRRSRKDRVSKKMKKYKPKERDDD